MRKLLSIFLAFIFGISISNAQISNIEVFDLGAKAGYNYSNLSNSGKGFDINSLSGYYFGLFIELPLNNRMTIQPEIFFSTQGATYSGKTTTMIYDGKLVLNYINIPLMVKYYITDNFNVEIGPQLSASVYPFPFISGTGESTYQMGTSYSMDYFTLDDKIISKVDLGFGLGASYKISRGFAVGARYNLGFIDVTKDEISKRDFLPEFLNEKFNNRVLNIGLSYQF